MAPAVRRGGLPGIGIFWTFDGRLIIDGVGLDEAVQNSGLKTYPGTHESLWLQYRSIMAVPMGLRQESLAKGRVIFDLIGGRFCLYADPCIVCDTAMLDRIRQYLNLPADIAVEPDPEYRCPNCTSKR
jgi:hypothetical protein